MTYIYKYIRIVFDIASDVQHHELCTFSGQNTFLVLLRRPIPANVDGRYLGRATALHVWQETAWLRLERGLKTVRFTMRDWAPSTSQVLT